MLNTNPACPDPSWQGGPVSDSKLAEFEDLELKILTTDVQLEMQLID